jgi:hypothetical protein
VDFAVREQALLVEVKKIKARTQDQLFAKIRPVHPARDTFGRQLLQKSEAAIGRAFQTSTSARIWGIAEQCTPAGKVGV